MKKERILKIFADLEEFCPAIKTKREIFEKENFFNFPESKFWRVVISSLQTQCRKEGKNFSYSFIKKFETFCEQKNIELPKTFWQLLVYSTLPPDF